MTALLKILEQLGANVRFLNRSDVEIDCRHIATTQVSQELAHKIRASYYLIGALLGRFGEAEVSMPGGCNFGGVRPSTSMSRASPPWAPRYARATSSAPRQAATA